MTNEPLPKATVEQWAYVGVRVEPGRKDRLIDCWYGNRGTSGETLWMTKRTGSPEYIIGGIYSIRVSRDGQNITRHGLPRYTGEVVDDLTRLSWAADDQRARLDRQRFCDMRNASRMDALDQALHPFKTLVADTSHDGRLALLAALIDLLLQEPDLRSGPVTTSRALSARGATSH